MPALQVRDFPQELYDELREYAAQNHRSIAQQTIACVENEIRRNKATAGQDGASDSLGDPADIPIPPAVREAAARARDVGAYGWAGVFRVETEQEREDRRMRWQELRGRFADLAKLWNGPAPSCADIAQMVHDGRDGRTDRIMMNVEGYLATEGQG